MATNLRTTELDFSAIKTNLKAFLKDQDIIKDYDYEGSTANILLDILAANTHYNALMSNYTGNEMFIDSALHRDNVVSHAKSFGYLPRSAHSAVAVINIAVAGVAGNPDSIELLPGVAFNTTVDDLPYQFVTRSSYTATKNSNNIYIFTNVPIYEGTFLRKRYTVQNSINERFLLPNAGVDTNTISVKVRNASGANLHTYQFADDILELDETSQAYFVQETYDGKHEIYFGDGITGKKPASGESVEIEYIVTNGKKPNGAAEFTIAGNVAGSTRVACGIVSVASGGSDKETTDEIKKNAINFYRTQNRAVTADDFAVLVKKTGQNVKDCVVWGGEQNVPPRFGAVFLCVIPHHGSYLTVSERAGILNFLKPRLVANTHVYFTDPDYVDVVITSQVYYNTLILQNTPDTVKFNIATNIVNYSNVNLNEFSTLFKYSTLQNIIDETDIAITSNLTTIGLAKEWNPRIGTFDQIAFTYGNTIKSGSVFSSSFFTLESTESQYFKDDGQGKIQRLVGTKVLDSSAGTIDYNTGYINMKPIVVSNYIGSAIKFNATPQVNDVIGLNNNILRIKPENINLILTQDDRIK